MHLPFAAAFAYLATFMIAVASAVAHPWFDTEAHFVKAVVGMAKAAASMLP